MVLRSIDPATGDLLREYEETPPAEVARILSEARDAFGAWRRTTFAERAAPMRRAGALLRERRAPPAMHTAPATGKPPAHGTAQGGKGASRGRPDPESPAALPPPPPL